jgi:hypothetical protein
MTRLALSGLLALVAAGSADEQHGAKPALITQQRSSGDAGKTTAEKLAKYAPPEAIKAMQQLFSQPGLMNDKAIMALVQGQTVNGFTAPQKLAPFIAPYALPTNASITAWTNYNTMMMAFWYRFEFGFLVFKTLTKDQSKWLDAAIHYFDMLANSYIATNQFLLLYTALEAMKGFSASNPKSYFTGHLARTKLYQAYGFLWWIYNQNTLNLLAIHKAVGFPVEAKTLAYYYKAAPYSQLWAFMWWDIASDLSRWHLFTDGKPWDTVKVHTSASLWYAKQFIWAMRSLAFAAVSDEKAALKPLMTSWAPYIGFSLSPLAYAMAFHTGLAAGTASGAPVKATAAAAAAKQRVL